ncbi:MAG: hypothetical protein H0V29_11935 [Thermoleophilaceae bacterium]|nr:hypothetical protein [Thermoleophilaceae bacterium]
MLVVGLGFGVLFALPIPDIEGKCLPAGEGLVQCVINRQVLPSVLRVVIGCVGAVALFEAFSGAPGLYHRWRAGEFKQVVGENPPWQDDPVLVASVWGATYDDAKAAKGGLHSTRIARRLRDRNPDYAGALEKVPGAVPADLEERVRLEHDARVAAVALTLDALEKLAAQTPPPLSAPRPYATTKFTSLPGTTIVLRTSPSAR